MADQTTPKFIGVSIQDFLEITARQADSGRFDDGTSIDPRFRDSLAQFSKSLSASQLSIRNYVFVFSKYIFIVVEF